MMFRNRRGQGGVEYLLILLAIIVAVIAAGQVLGPRIQRKATTVGQQIGN